MTVNGQSLCYHQVLASAELGGGDLVGIEIAAFLSRQGRTSRVWAPGDGPAWKQLRAHHLTGESFDGPGLLKHGLVRPLLATWWLSRGLRRYGPGLVHVHSPLMYGAIRPALWLAGLPRVVHVQLEETPECLRWAFRHPPELIITCARFLADYVRRQLSPRHQQTQRIVAVPNAVDTERFQPGDRQAAKAKVGAPPATPLVLMLANLAPHKGQETTLHAVAELKRRGVEVACWLAGEERGGTTTCTERLRQLVHELGIADRVQLLGYRDDAPDLLRAADFFLLPSTCEGLPLTVLEAQATRVPVLAAPTAGIPEVIRDGESGFLLAAADASAYAATIQRLLQDRGLREHISTQAFDYTTRAHSWRAFCTAILDLYQELLARQEQPGRTSPP